MKQVEIFIGGACNGNPGPGGWGAILRLGPHEKLLSGGAPETTRNRMELTAAIHGLRALIEPCEVTVITRSRFVIDGITPATHGWTRSGWANPSMRPVRNADLWHDLIAVAQQHQARWEMISDDGGHQQIERAERLASEAAHTA